jgi:hypothetical protein
VSEIIETEQSAPDPESGTKRDEKGIIIRNSKCISPCHWFDKTSNDIHFERGATWVSYISYTLVNNECKIYLALLLVCHQYACAQTVRDERRCSRAVCFCVADKCAEVTQS